MDKYAPTTNLLFCTLANGARNDQHNIRIVDCVCFHIAVVFQNGPDNFGVIYIHLTTIDLEEHFAPVPIVVQTVQIGHRFGSCSVRRNVLSCHQKVTQSRSLLQCSSLRCWSTDTDGGRLRRQLPHISHTYTRFSGNWICYFLSYFEYCRGPHSWSNNIAPRAPIRIDISAAPH